MRRVLLIFTLMLVSAVAWAEDGVVVETRGGVTVGYVFSETPVITYEGLDLVVTTSKTTAQYPIDDLARVYFDDVSITAINEVASKQIIRVVNDVVEMTGFAAGTVVNVYDINGRQIVAHQTDANGALTLSLAGCNQGVLIIKAGKSTLKVKH